MWKWIVCAHALCKHNMPSVLITAFFSDVVISVQNYAHRSHHWLASAHINSPPNYGYRNKSPSPFVMMSLMISLERVVTFHDYLLLLHVRSKKYWKVSSTMDQIKKWVASLKDHDWQPENIIFRSNQKYNKKLSRFLGRVRVASDITAALLLHKLGKYKQTTETLSAHWSSRSNNSFLCK